MNTYATPNDKFVQSGIRTGPGDAEHFDTVGGGVSWSAILAGATAAAALSLIMILMGAGMGLGLASPWEAQGADARTIGMAGVFWITFTQIAASGLGGYLAGRLRTKWSTMHSGEVGFRDTAHGFLAWAAATLVTAALMMSAVGATVGAGARAGASLASGAASMAAVGVLGGSRTEDDSTGPMGYWTDSLLRKTPPSTPQAASSASPVPQATGTSDVTPGAGSPGQHAGRAVRVSFADGRVGSDLRDRPAGRIDEP